MYPMQVFHEIRNEHFSNVFSFLSQKARNLQAQYDVRLPARVSCLFPSVTPQVCCPVAPLLTPQWVGAAGRAVVAPL